MDKGKGIIWRLVSTMVVLMALSSCTTTFAQAQTVSNAPSTSKAFSCIVLKSGEVYWEAGIDSCDELINKFKLQDAEKTSYAKVEIVPDNDEKYLYLHPEKPWKLVIDETVTPSWLTQKHKAAAWKAFEEWKKTVYQFDYMAVLNPFDPAKAEKHEPTEEDILLLKEWASVWEAVRNSGSSIGSSVKASGRDSVGACVWGSTEQSVEAVFRALHVDCPGAVVCQGIEASLGTSLETSLKDTIGDSVGDGLGALVGSYFPNIKKWQYYEGEIEGYPYQAAAELWNRGFIPSFDGRIWRLSSGKEASVVFEISEEELLKEK